MAFNDATPTQYVKRTNYEAQAFGDKVHPWRRIHIEIAYCDKGMPHWQAMTEGPNPWSFASSSASQKQLMTELSNWARTMPNFLRRVRK